MSDLWGNFRTERGSPSQGRLLRESAGYNALFCFKRLGHKFHKRPNFFAPELILKSIFVEADVFVNFYPRLFSLGFKENSIIFFERSF